MLRDSNAMTDMTFETAERRLAQGVRFVMENPGRSRMWNEEAAVKLLADNRITVVEFHNCMYGGRRREHTKVVGNVPALASLAKWCDCEARCSRTGLPHETWRPAVKGGRVQKFRTKEEAEYPPSSAKRRRR